MEKYRNTIQQALNLPDFEKHKKEWFLNRVGETVTRSLTKQTPSSEFELSIVVKDFAIASENHAIACYDYHIRRKVNYEETQIKTK